MAEVFQREDRVVAVEIWPDARGTVKHLHSDPEYNSEPGDVWVEWDERVPSFIGQETLKECWIQSRYIKHLSE